MSSPNSNPATLQPDPAPRLHASVDPATWASYAAHPDSASEAERLTALLSGFRLASVRLAERAPQARLPRRHPAASTHPHLAPRWLALAATLAFLLLASWLVAARLSPTHRSSLAQVHPQGQRPAELSDEALLQSVQQDLSESVPNPLRSLVVTSQRSATTHTTASAQ